VDSLALVLPVVFGYCSAAVGADVYAKPGMIGMVHLIRWLYLNLRYRLGTLPQDPAALEKLAVDLRIPLAFTYRASGLDMTLAQQRIHKSLNSFRWLAPLAIIGLFFALLARIIHGF